MSSGGKNPPQLHFDDGSRIILNNPASSSSSSSKNRDNISSHDHYKQEHQQITTATITNPRGDIPIPIYYEIERIAQEIVHDIIPKITKTTTSNTTTTGSNNGFLCRVALQFPDELLDDSTQVSWLMEEAIVTHYHQHQYNVKDEKDNDNVGDTIIPLPPLVFVLGDTTYASCCPDEIGALHLNADVIVHYGQYACLSVSDSLDVIYSFGVQEWLDDEMISCVESIVGQIIESSLMQGVKEKIILVGERRYQHHLGLLSELLWKKGEEVVDHVVVGTVPISNGKKRTLTSCGGGGGGHGTCGGMNPCCQQESTPCYDDNDDDVVIEPQQGEKESESESESSILGGLQVAIPPSQLSQYILVYIGDDTGTCKSRQYLNTLLKCISPHSHTKSFWSYNPITQTLSTSITTNNSNAAISRYLNRRFYLVQKAKLANIYGILVGTLSQDRFRNVIASIRHKILQSGRTCYTFVVGKINIAKIANFAEVECFVLVACGETSVLRDEREFHVPIVTPMELEIALGEKEWGGPASCSTDFTDFLQTCVHNNVEEEDGGGCDDKHDDNNKNQDDYHEDDDDDNDDDKPFYSMISGTYVSRPTSSLQPNNIKNLDDHSNDSTTENNNDMSSIPGQGQLTKYHSAAAEFWKKREYKGLEANIGRNDTNAAIQGQSGIASDYGK